MKEQENSIPRRVYSASNIIHKEYYIYKYTMMIIIIIIYAFVNSREGPVESVRPVYVLYVE